MANPIRRHLLCSLVMLPAAALLAPAANAHSDREASAVSSLSLSLPVAVLVAAPTMFLIAGAALTVVAIEASATGSVWVVRRATDGAVASLQFSGAAVSAAAIGVGALISVTAVAAGWLLSTAGEVLCLVPNALGESLLYNERIR